MLHRDDGVEVLVAKDAGSAGGDVLVRQRIGRWEIGLRLCRDGMRIARRPESFCKKYTRLNVVAPASATGDSLSMVRLTDGWVRVMEVVSLEPYMRCGPVMGISSLFF